MSKTLRFALAALLLPVALGGCNPNTQEQRDAAKAAADSYCDCAEALLKTPVDELGKMRGDQLCRAESDAYNAAWEALPARADGDDEAAAISSYLYDCHKILRDAHGIAWRAANR